MNQLLVLDVGHGNCSVVRSGDLTAVVDSPSGPTLLDTLDKLGIKVIHHVFVSHADKDHVDGITALLLDKDRKVERVYVNPDAKKDTKTWERFRVAAQDADSRGTKIVASLNASYPGDITFGSLQLSVLAPEPIDSLGGPGSKLGNDKKLDANTLSAVIKVLHGKNSWALLAGDMDQRTLEAAKKNNRDLNAQILIFPHHGGLPGDEDPAVFAQQLCETVKPAVVVFSNSRDGAFDNPRPAIIAGIGVMKPRIACTQLSKTCLASTAGLDYSHLSSLPARGAAAKLSCAGTIIFTPEDSEFSALKGHREFLKTGVKTGQCTKLNS